MVVNMLDEVAWLLNLRGSDIEYNPVFFAYSVVDAAEDRALLFVNEAQLDGAVSKHLGGEVEVRPYGTFFGYLGEMQKGLKDAVSLAVATRDACRGARVLMLFMPVVESIGERQGKSRGRPSSRESTSVAPSFPQRARIRSLFSRRTTSSSPARP